MLINGQPCDTISANDRGLQYGDGLFETIAVDKWIPLCLSEHLDRLARGCRRLRIPEPARASLQQEIHIVSGELQRGIVKVIITRGVGGRGYAPTPTTPVPNTAVSSPNAAASSPTRLVAGFQWPDYPIDFSREGIDTCLCDTRLGRNVALAGIKHLNRLEQVLGRIECAQKGVPEGIMLDSDGCLIEGTMSNLFLVRGNQLITPVLAESGVRGITRDRIIHVAEMVGIDVRVTRLDPSALFHADGLFFCNSVMGIWPVKRFVDRCYSVPPVIRRLRRELIEGRVILV
uniref:Aminodeoxychorismate lyase n=1 Tax=Candidatus Kentrum sp. LFY TaxID=2126342 RepID=A0A450WG18_9GAMM|nr:MAG: aminodeoxychorismate lyase apoprotein [Candidatus Kentron sp. LFY]